MSSRAALLLQSFFFFFSFFWDRMNVHQQKEWRKEEAFGERKAYSLTSLSCALSRAHARSLVRSLARFALCNRAKSTLDLKVSFQSRSPLLLSCLLAACLPPIAPPTDSIEGQKEEQRVGPRALLRTYISTLYATWRSNKKRTFLHRDAHVQTNEWTSDRPAYYLGGKKRGTLAKKWQAKERIHPTGMYSLRAAQKWSHFSLSAKIQLKAPDSKRKKFAPYLKQSDLGFHISKCHQATTRRYNFFSALSSFLFVQGPANV